MTERIFGITIELESIADTVDVRQIIKQLKMSPPTSAELA
jgi:hypothetical protein